MGTDKIREENAAAAGARREPQGPMSKRIRITIECPHCFQFPHCDVIAISPIVGVIVCECGRQYRVNVEVPGKLKSVPFVEALANSEAFV
jgi:hypothetical protein